MTAAAESSGGIVAGDGDAHTDKAVGGASLRRAWQLHA